MSNWISNIRGHKDRMQWEISIVKEDNKTGKNSYGRWGKEKLCVSQSTGNLLVDDDIWDGLVALSIHVADVKNKMNGLKSKNKIK